MFYTSSQPIVHARALAGLPHLEAHITGRSNTIVNHSPNSKDPNPRQQVLNDLQEVILKARDLGHSVLLMLDANGTIPGDSHLRNMISTSGLHDLHYQDPAKSTYIGATHRRIDLMLGCSKVFDAITHAGTLSYVEGPQSDHRALYIDLDVGKLLSFNPHDNTIQPQPVRMLKTGNPELVATYHTKVLEYYESHNMASRIRKLFANHSKLSDDQLRKRLEKWDRDQGRAMKHAEMSLKKQRLQKHSWSPQLRNLGMVCRYWNLRLYGLRNNRDISQTISRLQTVIRTHDSRYSFPLQQSVLSEEEITKYWKTAKKELKTCQSKAQELRYKSYEELLATYEMDPSPESRRRGRIVASTIRTEKCREMFRQISLSAKPFRQNSGGLNSIMIPGANDMHLSDGNTSQRASEEKDIYAWLNNNPGGPQKWETVIEQSEVERHLLNFNHASFRAASTSPCGHGVIMDALTFSSMSPAGQQFLQGIIPPEWYGDNQLLKEFLSSFFYPPHHGRPIAEISTKITEEDVKKGFGKMEGGHINISIRATFGALSSLYPTTNTIGMLNQIFGNHH